MLAAWLVGAALLLDASAAVPSCFVATAPPASLRHRLTRFHATAAQPSLPRSARRGGGPVKPDAGEDEAEGLVSSILASVGAAWWRVLSVSAGMLCGAACELSLIYLCVPNACPGHANHLTPPSCARPALPAVSCFSHSLGSTVAAVCVCAGLGTRRQGAPGGGSQNAPQPQGRVVEEAICCGCAGADCSAIFFQSSAACRESIG